MSTTEGYLNLLDFQPATQYKRDLFVLTSQLSRFIKRVDATVRIILTIVIGYLLFRLYIWLIPIIYQSWEKAEPFFAIIELVIGGGELLIVILIGAQPEKLGFIKAFVRGAGTLVLRTVGINRKDVEKRINEYKGESVDLLLRTNATGLPIRSEDELR